MRTEKQGKYFVNSRVDVDYSKKKPKIKFSYPQKNPKKTSFFNEIMLNPIFLILFVIIVYGGFLFFMTYQYETPYPSDCSGYFMGNVGAKEVYGLNISCNTGNYTLKYNTKRDLIGKNNVWTNETGSDLSIPYLLGILFLFWLLLVVVLRLIFRRQKWYHKFLPESMAKGKKRYYKFTNKDVENNLIKFHFKNHLLDYKTKGDFNKYLKRIKIVEDTYYPYRTKGKKKGKGKLIKDDCSWYAIFYFSNKPKIGWLEVIYQ